MLGSLASAKADDGLAPKLLVGNGQRPGRICWSW